MKPQVIAVCAAAVLALANAISTQGAQSPEEYLRVADDQYRNALRDEALANYRKAADAFEQAGNTQGLVHSLNQVGVVLTRQDKYPEARRYLDRALAVGLASLGPQDLTIAATYLALGVVESAEGQFDRSLDVHNKALAIRLSRLGRINADVATSYGNIGNVHFRKQEYDRAIEAHEQAMQIRSKVFGEAGPEIVESYRGLGNAYREKKDYARALEYFNKALANKLAQLGEGHRDLGRYYLQISEVHALAGNVKQAGEYKAMAAALEGTKG